MGKFNCINRKSKEFKDLKSNLSKALGLTDITVTDETLLDVIDLFAADNDITEVEALDRMEELSKYIEDYFGFNTKYTPDSDLQEQYDEWFNDNIDYINTPYTPIEETNEFEEDAKVITEEKAKVVNLSNGQRMVVIPNSPLPAIAKEMQSIKEKAVADGTFMKAPNGKPTNLTEQQWLQVRTKAFKEWFGDWENNPENASKVVDENGEPKVVWRASRYGKKTDYSVFDLEKTGGQGFYFANKEAAEKWYGGDNMRAFFLNLRNPDTSNNFNTLQSEAKYFDENDGVIFAPKGTEDIAFEVKVFSSNQIKSATDNIGTFSTLSNNIYYNLSSKSLENFLKNKHLVHNYNGQLLITKKDAESLDKAESNFKKELTKLGYSEDSVKLTRQANSIRVEVLEAKRKADYIEAEINYSMSSIKNVIDFLTEKIPALKDKVHYNVSKAEAKKVLGDAYSDNVNSFVHNGEIYLLEGKATEDIAIEEALHILTESLIIDNKALAYELLHEAEKLFPQLVDEIRRTYEGADTQNREILTQALARVFRQEFNEGERQTVESILSKFINWIKQLFGINPTTGNTIIELEELSTNMTIRDFARLINSSNAEFRTWSHTKTQFNKSSVKFTTSEGGYPQRRKENIDLSDATIAFATDFTTAGEKGTKRDAGKKYNRVKLYDAKDRYDGTLIKDDEDIEAIVKRYKGKGPIKLNIAGNGIYTFKSYTQEDLNSGITGIIRYLIEEGIEISEIRSGGQTGIDEAGIIAAQRLGIPAVVHGTKDWAFRGKDNKDVKGDEKAYKARFVLDSQTSSASITKSQVEKALVNFTPISSYGKPQNILYMDGRYFTVVNINGINIPFYMSSGLGGKKTVESGKWYPFFGISKKGWLNKGSEEEINNYYDSPELKEIANHLDVIFPSTEYGISKKDGIIEPTGKGEQVSKGNFFNFDEVVNKDLSPVENKTATTKKEVSKNVDKVINSFKKASQSRTSKKKLTLEDRVAEIEEMISAFNRTIIKDKDFYNPGTEGEHKYYIKTDKGSKKVDISVTALNEELLGEKFEGKKNITYPQGHIGNSFDALVRDYFNGGITTQVYPNFNRRNIERLTKQLDQFVKQLDGAFGKGEYKVITKDWSLGGYVTVNGKKKSVAGSIDMMVVTESGDIYIYDMKTTSKDISSSINKYTGQLTFYKELIGINYPEIAKRIKGVGLLVCDINFGRKFGSTNYGKYSIKKGTKDQLLFDGSEIQKEAGHINPVIQTSNTGIGGFILDLQASQTVEDLKMHPLKMQKIETEEDFVAKETQKSLFEKGSKKVENNDDEIDNLGTVKEIVNTDADLCPVPDVEITYLGNAIIKLLSAYLDELNTDDEARINYLSNDDGTNGYAEGYFTSLDRDQILTSDVFHKLLEYIKHTHFNPVDKSVEPGSELQHKLIWIQDHFNAIVNSGFATLINLEKVALTMSKDTSSENENEEITRQLAEEEREESQQMAFDIDSKEKSYMDSIPAQLKTKLSKIYKMTYDDNGNPLEYIYDEYDYLIPTFEDKHYVVNTIMSLVHGCTNVNTMIEILRNNNTTYPWLNVVIGMLEEDPMLKTQFFRTFRKNATLYNKLYKVVERDKEGTIIKVYYKSEPLTIKGKIDKIVGNLNVNIEANNVPLFDKVKTGVVSINEDEFEKLKENITKLSKVKNPASKDITILRKVLRSLGFDNIDNVRILKDKKYRKAFLDLTNSLGALNAKLTTLNKKGKPFTYNSELNKSFYFISQSLSVAMNDEYEISVYDGGKSRMTYTEPTALQTLIETLGNVNPDFTFEDALREKYGKYAQFVNDNGYISSWLEELSADTELQDWIKHVIRTTFDDTTYLEQNDAQYALSLMLDYASPRIKNSPHSVGTKLPLAFFRVPIMSDKNSSESILFKTYALKYNDNEAELEEMKDTIADKMHQFFLQEIKRMRSIYEQLWNEPETDVEFYHLGRTPEVEEIKKRGRGKLTVEDFLKLRNQKRFNGFKFHYTPMFNSAIEKDAKLAQMIVDAINGKKTTGLRKKYDKYFKDGVDERFESWKANIENTIPNLAKKLSASLDFIRTIPSSKTKELTDYDAFLQEYYWNDYLATCNIYNLTIIDPAFNKDVTDLQKRFAQVHSATIKCDTEAVFMDEYGIERKYSDGTFRFVILDDLSRGTSLKEDIKQVFLDAAKKAEKTNPKKAKELKLLAKTIPSEFDKIDFTDGQGYSSPTGFWKKLSMLGEYDDQLFAYVHTLKDSLDKISKGDFSIANFDMVKQAFKPFVFGHSPHVNDNTVMGEYLVPTQIKDSEAMLVLAGAILRASENNHPLTAIFEFMENSHWKEENGRMIYQDDGIDTVVFHSAVKQGAYGIVNINDAKSKDEALELLNNAIVHELPYDAWGKQTEVPEHFQDHTQGMGSQQRVLAVSDIDDDAIITVNRKTYNKKAFLKKYFTLISKDMKEGIKEVEKLLKLKGTQKEKNKALSDLLVKAVVKDAKYTDSLRRAFTLNANGEFDIPLGDPTIADKFFSVLFSLVKNNVNLQKFPGGPTVQMSVYGMDEDLGIKYLNPKEKTGLYCEAMITCPTQELENKITVTNENFKEVKKKFKNKYQVGDMLDVDDAIILGYMTDEDAWFIFNRIPTEDKYSLWACRVKRFLPRQMGEFVILPKETLRASGYDLDIDKGFITFKFSNPKTASQKRKNEIFEFQLASLLHNGTLEKSFNPGSFDELKKLAAQVDPTFGSSDISLMFLDGQYYYRRNNAAGKQYVGIAALNNTCHGLCNMAGVGFKSMIDFKVNGVSSLNTYNEETNEYTFDATYSVYDGTRISRTLGMFVGAAADNAKDAVLAFVGCTPTTGTFVNGLIRMGIPLDIIVYMMTNPAVKELIRQAEFDDIRFEEVVANAVKDSMEVVIETLSKTDFKSKDLLNRITKEENKEIDKKILYFLKAMTPYVLAIADTNTIMSLNSTKNSVGPDVYSTIKKELDIEDVFDRIESDRSVLGDSCNKDNLLESLPFLGELIYCYDTLIPKIARAHSPLYQGEFKTVLKKFKKLGFWVDDKFIKQTYNAYLVYKATALGVLDGTYQGRKATIFETPLHVFKDKQSVENTFLSYLNIKKRMNKKTNIPTVAGINTGLSVEFRDLLSANWTALSKDSRTKKLSDLIIEHFLYKFGFMFNPSSPLTMLSSYSKLNFKEGNYGSIFEENNNVDNIDNFVIQYARNNPDTPLWDTIDEEEKPIIELKKGILKIDSEIHERVEDTVGIKLGSSLFVYEKSVGTTDIYKEVTSLGIEKNFLEYNGAVSGVDMETVITKENKDYYTNMYNVLISEESVEEVEDFEVETPEGEDNEGKIKSTKSSIYERQDLEELLSKKEYKAFKSKVSKKEDGVLKEIWEKLRRDKDNKSEYQELLKALKDVC